jgi:hypothetical protein
MKNKNDILVKAVNVIDSCKSLEQLDVAINYVKRLPDHIKDLSTISMAIKRKVKEL